VKHPKNSLCLSFARYEKFKVGLYPIITDEEHELYEVIMLESVGYETAGFTRHSKPEMKSLTKDKVLELVKNMGKAIYISTHSYLEHSLDENNCDTYFIANIRYGDSTYWLAMADEKKVVEDHIEKFKESLLKWNFEKQEKLLEKFLI